MSESLEGRELRLPRAEVQYPRCGACEAETWHDGNHLICDDCGLWFESVSMEAHFTHPDDPACGKPCGNTWHAPNAITKGRGYECRPCALTEGHESGHWSGCIVIPITNELEESK